MRYSVRINKRVRNVHVYKVIKKTSGNANIFTKLFLSIFAGKEKREERREERMKV